MNEVDVTVVRIYLHEREPRLKNIMQVLHDELHVRGVTAFRGIAGFGARVALSAYLGGRRSHRDRAPPRDGSVLSSAFSHR